MLKVSVMSQVIKKYIYLSGEKSYDPLHVDYVPNVFKFTKISAKRTQESLRQYELTQKRQRRPNATTSKIFPAPYICNNSRMLSLHYFHYFCNLHSFNYFLYSVLLFFYFKVACRVQIWKKNISSK